MHVQTTTSVKIESLETIEDVMTENLETIEVVMTENLETTEVEEAEEEEVEATIIVMSKDHLGRKKNSPAILTPTIKSTTQRTRDSSITLSLRRNHLLILRFTCSRMLRMKA